MRLRRKKNQEQRLEAAASVIIPTICDDLDFRASQTAELLDIHEIFGRDGQLRLEIGCGKGGFILEAARREPDVNFIAVEKSSAVAVTACELLITEKISNVRVMICCAQYLTRFIPEASVNRIYLNFSCPFPKTRYATHRLTHPRFLEEYARLLEPGGEIYQKTDDRSFFAYSIENYTTFGYALKNVSLDLHADNPEDNIETEYESRFAAQGKPIYRLEAYIRQGKGIFE